MSEADKQTSVEHQVSAEKPASTEKKLWPNGSAVFEAGCARHFVGVPDETIPGFLGRTVREEGGWRVLRWNGSRYVDLGVKADFASALERLGGNQKKPLNGTREAKVPRKRVSKSGAGQAAPAVQDGSTGLGRGVIVA